MRELAGLVALDAGMLAAGVVVLAGLGIARGRGLVRYAGVALMIGWAATGVLLSLALAAGLSLSVVLVVAIWVLVAAAGLLGGRRLRGEPWRPEPAAAERARGLVWLGRGGVALGLTAMALRCWFPDGHLHPDVWNVWFPKAKIIYFAGTLTTAPGGFTSQISPDYPPLDTGLAATAFRFMGGADVLRLPLQSWILAIGFLWALVALLRLRTPQHVAWLGVGLLALMPSYVKLVGSGLADEPLSVLFALLGVTTALWIVLRDSRLLVLAALFAGAATLTKNEGSMLVLVAVVGFAVAVRRARWTLVLASGPVVCAVAWRLWQHEQHVPRNFAYDFTKIADVPYLGHRVYRAGYGLAQVSKALVSPSHWLLIPVALLVLAALGAHARPLGRFALVTFVLGLLGYVAIYWISPVPLHAYIDSSATRVVDTLALFAAALLPLVLQALPRSNIGLR